MFVDPHRNGVGNAKVHVKTGVADALYGNAGLNDGAFFGDADIVVDDIFADVRPVFALPPALRDIGDLEREIIDRLARDRAVVAAADQPVRAFAADQRIVAGSADQRVEAFAAIKGICANAACNAVVAPPGVNPVVADARIHVVAAVAASQHVVAAATGDLFAGCEDRYFSLSR